MCLPLALWHRFAAGRAGNLFNDCIDVNSITEILTKMHESNFRGVCSRQAGATRGMDSRQELWILFPESREEPRDGPVLAGAASAPLGNRP